MPHRILSYNDALNLLDELVGSLFVRDNRIQSLGITRFGDGYGFRVTRNMETVIPQRGIHPDPELPVPIEYVDVFDVVRPLSKVARYPEQNIHRPLVCGLQIQNFDHDDRTGNIKRGLVTRGSIGCFVRSNGVPGVLSNNHVLAAENSAFIGDQIMQPATMARRSPVATLKNFVSLQYSPPHSKPGLGNVRWNEEDAAVALVEEATNCSQSYLPHNAIPSIANLGSARPKDRVFKVGQASGLTAGRVTATNTVVEVQYNNGSCWFRNSFEITGNYGVPFSQQGDSGAVVLNNSGSIVGMLYAATPTTAYAFPIDSAMLKLQCTLL